MPGVVFSGALDGHLRAYDSTTGKVLWDVDTAQAYDSTMHGVAAKGGGMNGPGATVAGGMVFVNSGYGDRVHGGERHSRVQRRRTMRHS